MKALIVIFGICFLIFIWLEIKSMKVKKWRKNPEVGNVCYFRNFNDEKTFGTIKEVFIRGQFVLFESHEFGNKNWVDINELYPA